MDKIITLIQHITSELSTHHHTHSLSSSSRPSAKSSRRLAQVITCNIGMAASMASFILGAGERGKRIALPHSRVMIHQPMGGSEGQAEDIRVEAEQILKIKGTLVTMYAQMTGQTRERIIKDLDRDNYMSAQQALDYGLIDRIVTHVDA